MSSRLEAHRQLILNRPHSKYSDHAIKNLTLCLLIQKFGLQSLHFLLHPISRAKHSEADSYADDHASSFLA